MKTWHKWALSIIVIVGVAVCIKSCADRKKPDLTIAYIGNDFVNRDMFEKNVGKISPLCADITSDGEISIDVTEISYSDTLSHADRSNSNQKMTNAIGNGSARLYFIEEEYVKKNMDIGVFADLSELCKDECKTIENSNGEVVAISVFGKGKVSELGMKPTKTMYVAVRKITEMDSFWVDNAPEQNKSAMKVAEYVLAD